MAMAVLLMGCGNLFFIKHTVSFDPNGGTGTMAPISVGESLSATLTPNAFTRSGYAFAGWALSAGGPATFVDGAVFVMAGSDVTLYAMWTTIAPHTISFDANGGNGTMAALSALEGAVVTLTANAFTRSGCTFAGWGLSASATTMAYADGAGYTMGATDVTLYALWAYPVSFQGNGGTGTMTPVFCIPGSSLTLPACTFTAPSGEVFGGWITSSTGTSAAYEDKGSYTMGTSEATLYALWGTRAITVVQHGSDYTLTYVSGESLSWNNSGVGSDYAVDVTLTIANTGSLPLHLTATAPDYVTLSDDSLGFEIPTQPSAPMIPARGSLEFVVRYTSSSTETRYAVLTINSDDPDLPSFTLSLVGASSQ